MCKTFFLDFILLFSVVGSLEKFLVFIKLKCMHRKRVLGSLRIFSVVFLNTPVLISRKLINLLRYNEWVKYAKSGITCILLPLSGDSIIYSYKTLAEIQILIVFSILNLLVPGTYLVSYNCFLFQQLFPRLHFLNLLRHQTRSKVFVSRLPMLTLYFYFIW